MTKPYNPEVIADNIRYLMRKERVTIAMLAEWTDLTPKTLNNYRDPTYPSRNLEPLIKIAKVFRVTLDWLMEDHTEDDT